MCDAESELVDDVISLRNRLLITERNLQALGEELSQSENEILAEHKDGRGYDVFPPHLTLDDLQEPDAAKASSYPGFAERSSTPKPAPGHGYDYRPGSSREMENEAAQLRRKLSSVRQENSSLVLENRQLVSDLEATQLELAGSKSKLRVLGSSVGAKTSSMAMMTEHVLDLESQLEAHAKALRESELKRVASEQAVVLTNRLVEKLREELDATKAELADRTRQWKRTEQQRNRALGNAEELTAAFRDYKEEVAEKLKKVMENEGKLKAALLECDREREDLERERDAMSQNLRELREVRERSEALSAERLELQGRVQNLSEQLNQAQKELQEVASLRKEREDLRLLTACQEQRLEQSRAELTSLESIVDLLHLREVNIESGFWTPYGLFFAYVSLCLAGFQNRDGVFCASPCLLPSPVFAPAMESLQHKTGDPLGYQKLLAALQSVEKEKARQASAAQSLQERLSKAQEEICSLQTSITQRASHYQHLHNQLLDKAARSTALEKELKKKNSRLIVLEKQLQEKSSAYSQAAIKTSQLEQELMEKDSSIHHYQSVLKKKQREHQQAMEASKITETNKCNELEDRIELLQLSLAQSQAEAAELKHTVSNLQSEKQEALHQASVLQASVAQLTQEMELRAKRSEAAVRSFEEQALESASNVKLFEDELSCCKEELSHCLQQIEKAEQRYEKQLELKNSELSALQEAVRSRALACESSAEDNLQLQRSIQRQQTMLQESTAHIGQLEESQSRLQNQVSELEQDLERERSSSLLQLRRKEKEVEEAKQEMQMKDKQAAELSASITKLRSEMSACREELTEMEKELLHLRRDSSAKAAQLSQMEETLQETKGLLDKKSEMVMDLEEKLHRSEMDRRNSLQRAQAMEEQLKAVRGELADTLGHLEELRDVLQKTQLTADQQQAAIHQLTSELRESQRELEERNHEVLDMDSALKERQGELQQRAQLLGQLDVAIKEHKLEMERKVEHLQDVLEKTEKKLKERDQQVEFLTERLDLVKSQLQGREDLERSALEHGQQLRLCREQLQNSTQQLQEAHTRCDALNRKLSDITQLARQKETEVQQLQEQVCVGEKRRVQAEATATALQHEMDQQRRAHDRELSSLQQSRGQLLKVSDQISINLRNSQEQLEEARADANDLRSQLCSTEKLLQHANESLLIKESEIARLQAKISSLERSSEIRNSSLRHDSSSFHPPSPPLKDSLPPYPPSHVDSLALSSLCSTSCGEASSDVSLELSESLKASVRAALRPPSTSDSGWQGLSHPDQSCTSDMTFNPLTYMVDGDEPEEPEPDSLTGMLRFVTQTLALQEQHTQDLGEDGYSFKECVS